MEVSVETVYKQLKNLKPHKATGYDSLPPRLIKLGAGVLSRPLCALVNTCLRSATFPARLKRAEIIPVFKKGDRMSKSNYRPVSILPCISKIFESIIMNQMNTYMEPLLAPEMSGFRKGHSCQHVLLKFVEDTYSSLDNSEATGALLSDLSKAFDSLPYRLLIAKLRAYGFGVGACKLLANYFTDRLQRVKMGSSRSDWMHVVKGAPQGSMLGPLTYNIHSNDLLVLMSTMCSIYNYADDNTIAVRDKSIQVVLSRLTRCAEQMIDWFNHNFMKANPDKFQFIVFDKSSLVKYAITLNKTSIVSQDSVKLLGITFDKQLSFDSHIREICLKAGRKLSVLCRLSHILDTDAKLLLTNAFIMSQFEYCPCIWHFCSRSNSMKIERFQKRALRHIYSDYTSTYTQLRDIANVPLLYVKRLRKLVFEAQNMINKNGPTYLHEMLNYKRHAYNTRNDLLVVPEWHSKTYGYNTFKYQAVQLWNSLGNDKLTTQSMKQYMKNWNGPQCLCSYCILCVLNQM